MTASSALLQSPVLQYRSQCSHICLCQQLNAAFCWTFVGPRGRVLCKLATTAVCNCVSGTIISLKAKLVNTGNVRLRQTTWNTEWATPASAWSNCTVGVINATDPAAAVSTVDVAVGQELICTGEFNMTQSVMEEGHIKQLAASVGVTVTDAVSSLQSSRLVIAVPVEIYPELTVDVLDTDCIKPFRAGAGSRCMSVTHAVGLPK